MQEYREIEYRGAIIQVSNDGKVIWNNQERKEYYNADGYAVCSIKTDDGWRSVRIARLVALAFIPNPENLPEVNHKDYDRTNSNVENLEWITRKDNINYSKCNRPDYHGINNPNYGNKKLSVKYKEDKQYSIEKQSRKGLQNGRCRKISIIESGNIVKTFEYIVDCCLYLCERFDLKSIKLSSIRSQIDRSIRENRSYLGLTFIKE